MSRILLLLVALGLVGCTSPPEGKIESALGELQPTTLDASSFESLALSFTDPETQAVYRIAGPYRVLRTSEDALELEGMGYDYFGTSRLLLFQRGDAIWALARIEGREFLTRVN